MEKAPQNDDSKGSETIDIRPTHLARLTHKYNHRRIFESAANDMLAIDVLMEWNRFQDLGRPQSCDLTCCSRGYTCVHIHHGRQYHSYQLYICLSDGLKRKSRWLKKDQTNGTTGKYFKPPETYRSQESPRKKILPRRKTSLVFFTFNFMTNMLPFCVKKLDTELFNAGLFLRRPISLLLGIFGGV